MLLHALMNLPGQVCPLAHLLVFFINLNQRNALGLLCCYVIDDGLLLRYARKDVFEVAENVAAI